MNPDAPHEDQLRVLAEEITETKRLAVRLTPSPQALILHLAVGRILWWAIQSGEVLRVALEQGRAFATEPQLRHLLECVVEVLFLRVWPGGPHEAAARCYLWDLLEWDRHWNEWESAAAAFGPDVPDPPPPARESAEEAYQRERLELEARGEDVALFDRVWRDAKATLGRKRYHWTGRPTIRGRLRWLEDLGAEDQNVRRLAVWYRYRYGPTSYAVHASPRWAFVKIHQRNDGTWVANPRLGSVEEEVRSRAHTACLDLGNLRIAVQALYGAPPESKQR